MASEDDSEKTEQPTDKRLRDAFERGQVASSKEVNTWLILLTATIILAVLGPSMARSVMDVLTPFVAQPHAIPTDGLFLRDFFVGIVKALAVAAVVAAAMLVAAAVAGGTLQHGPLLTADPITPKLSKISPRQGFKRLFSTRSLVEFGKGLLKILIVGSIAGLVLWPQFDDLDHYVSMAPVDLLDELQRLSLLLLVTVVAVMAVIAVLDFIYQKYEHTKQLRMSKQEIKDEFKQAEGDPMVKGRLRQIRLERARRRMMQSVPEADVVITNPTHYAVALKYDDKTMDAPTLVAKGADRVAERIREIATENGIAIVENPPLCRALFAGVEIDQQVPVEHYQAVAEIISYVWRLRGRLPQRKPRTAPAAG
ncbi:MAG: flagellar biosynthesis protein FlhB [Rhodospirillaceae bacterium]|nr:flagellar biosynthesis protein FlhB [Rhodospirillaceae bacterium]|tara:strand:+ start:201 stop:1301 length:1101 start_codon:yes stop_codon:yes gene_type:complete